MTYTYDQLNRLATVVDNGALAGQNQTTYSYDAVGNLTSATLPNGTVISSEFDQMNRVTSSSVYNALASMSYGYSYGAAGNRLASSRYNNRPNGTLSSNYTYDSIYRLTEEDISAWQANGATTNSSLHYGLDPVGNRQLLLSGMTGIGSQTLSYDAKDRLTANTYDANGNTLAAGAKTFTYDSQDRMTKFNGGAVTMVYDGDGNRVAKTVGGVTTQYLVDDLNPTGLPQVVEEIVGGAVQRTYTYGVQRISQTQAGATSYYGYDAHGDVRFLMDGTGAMTDTYDYDAFGNIVGSTGTTPNVYRYQGEALDAETGLYYLRARYYDPVSGRFLNVDPMADQGEHPYTYAGADPVNGHDPTGRQDIIEYALTMWLVSAHVPPPVGHMSCLGGIVFSDMGSNALMAKMASCYETYPRPGTSPKNGSGKGSGTNCRDIVNFPENDQNKKNVVKRMLNENSANRLGNPSYGIGDDTPGAPTGPIVTWDSVELEDQYYLTVLTNRLNDPPSRRMWGPTLGDQARNAGGADFANDPFPIGDGIYQRALDGAAGTFECRDCFTAIAAYGAGPITPQFYRAPLLFWKGVRQNKKHGPGTIVIPYRLGDIRVNNTEFSPTN